MRPRFLVVLAVAVMAAVPSMAAAAPYRVKDLRQVSGPSPFAAGCPGAAFDATMITGQEVEPSITVNPANPRNIVGTWKQDVGPDSTRSDLVASSRDGGRTWRRSTIPGLSKCTGGTADGASDPWVSAGVDGTVYFSGLAPHFQGTTPLSAVVASRSRDGGRTWRVPATLSPPAEGNETPAITASPRRPGAPTRFGPSSLRPPSSSPGRGIAAPAGRPLSSSTRRSRTRSTLCPGSWCCPTGRW